MAQIRPGPCQSERIQGGWIRRIELKRYSEEFARMAVHDANRGVEDMLLEWVAVPLSEGPRSHGIGGMWRTFTRFRRRRQCRCSFDRSACPGRMEELKT